MFCFMVLPLVAKLTQGEKAARSLAEGGDAQLVLWFHACLLRPDEEEHGEGLGVIRLRKGSQILLPLPAWQASSEPGPHVFLLWPRVLSRFPGSLEGAH